MRVKWKYLLNIDTICIFVLFIVVAYFIFKERKKKYKFYGVDTDTIYKVAKGEYPDHIEDVNPFYLKDAEKHGYWGKVYEPKIKKKPKINKHEERCREIFQGIYGKKFKSVRPGWLKNPATGKNLELDGFCEDIRTPIGKGLAFEYDGVQHSKFNNHFHKNGEKEFIYQVKKDEFKTLMCKKKGVMLIRIPHFVPYDDLERYITNKLRDYKLLPLRSQNHSQYTSFSSSPEIINNSYISSQEEEYEEARKRNGYVNRINSSDALGFLKGIYK